MSIHTNHPASGFLFGRLKQSDSIFTGHEVFGDLLPRAELRDPDDGEFGGIRATEIVLFIQDRPGTPRRAERPIRLSVNISGATAEALRELSRDKDVSMAEAVRRLIGYGIVVYRAVRDGGDVLIRRDDKAERLILLD